MSSTPKRQHYLAQSYLKGFCREYLKIFDHQNKDNYRAWYYDIERNEYRKQHVNKIACERYFYSWDSKTGEKDFSIELSLSHFENTISPLIQEIDIITRDLQKSKSKTYEVEITKDQRMWLLEFLRIMIVRVPSLINTIKKGLKKEMSTIFPEHFDPKDESVKRDVLKVAMALGTTKKSFINIWMNREVWIFYPNHTKTSFITTDRPVTRFNKNNPDGIKYDDTEIYLPLTQNSLLMVTHNETDTGVLRFSALDDRRVIREFNKYQASYATQIIVGRDKELIRSILKNLTINSPPQYKNGRYSV